MREAELVDAASPGLHDTLDAVSPVPYSTRDRDQVIRSHQTDRVREADVMDAASSSPSQMGQGSSHFPRMHSSMHSPSTPKVSTGMS